MTLIFSNIIGRDYLNEMTILLSMLNNIIYAPIQVIKMRLILAVFLHDKYEERQRKLKSSWEE